MLLNRTLCVLALSGLSIVGLPRAHADDAPPATRPSADQKLTIAPDVQKQLDDIRDAYRGLKSLDLVGTMSGAYDIAGEKKSRHSDFTAQYLAPNKFRHDSKSTDQGELLIGSNGDKYYMYVLKQNVYMLAEAPKTKANLVDPQGDVQEMLPRQDPSLALAVTADPEALLLDGATGVTSAQAVTIDGASYPAITVQTDDGDTTYVIDPRTHLIRRVTEDVTHLIKDSGIKDVNPSSDTIDYSKSTADAPEVKEDLLAWQAPANAQKSDDDQPEALALVGQPAPDFKLQSLDGKTQTLANQKGSVVLLDFWATWCGPCRMSLPHLNELNERDATKGVKIFALDQREEKDVVQKFITDNNYTFPVLMDSDGAAAAAYKVNGIPQTVLIGKDGTVKKVWVGYGPLRGRRIQTAVNAALGDASK